MTGTLGREPYFGFKGGWLTFWITVSDDPYVVCVDSDERQFACATDMTLFGYDQGVFSESP
ncbi:unnamed protein product [Aureobasidium pullulans]|nr:unnamed protein product [Aureobasidium pullulans]